MADPGWEGRPLGRRQFVFGGTALAATAAGLVLVPRSGSALLPRDVLINAIPTKFGEWGPVPAQDFILPLEDEEVGGIYGDVLARGYTNPAGAVVMLVIAYAGRQTGTIVIHRPEACYPANGFTLSNRAELTIADAAVGIDFQSVCYTATSYDRTEQLLYWTRVGTYFPTDWITEQLALVRSNLAGQLPDGVLVRMSVISDDVGASRTLLHDFAKALSEAVTTVGHGVLFSGARAARSPG